MKLYLSKFNGYNSLCTVQTSKDSFVTQSNLVTATSCKIRKQIISFKYTMAQTTLSIPIWRNVYIGTRQERNPTGQTLNPITGSQTHGTSVSKCLHVSIPATSHTSLSFSSTPHMYLNILWSQNIARHHLHTFLKWIQYPHWGCDFDKHGRLE